ncbi:MAG: Fe-S oxidoreductase, partial [Bacteroidetes bacterium]
MSFQSIIFAVILLASFINFGLNVRRLISYLNIGKPESRNDNPSQRIKNVLAVAFGHTKLLREPLAGIMHFFIFWGFVILLLAILESIGEGLIPGFSFSFLGALYKPLVWLQDVIGVLVVVSIGIALYRRYISKPKRLDVSGHAQFDATLILLMILIIMLSMFAQNGLRISLGMDAGNAARMFSHLFSSLFTSVSDSGKELWFSIFWWIHIGFVLGFMN